MIGKCLNTRYRLDAELGRGGLGVIYRAHDLLLDRQVAVKLLSNTGVGTSGRVRLLNEARSAAKLNHPNIVSVYDAGESPPEVEGEQALSFIVMELIEGESLYVHRPQPVDEILTIAEQVCVALAHAHANGIVHRDLKPENVLITPDGTAKLTDFGLARSQSSRMTQEGVLAGTVFYLAPEMAMGQPVDGRTDLYALGVMLYELAAGQLPFLADDPLAVIAQHLHAPVTPPSTYNPQIPSKLDALIARLMSKRPEDRPASAQETLQILRDLREAPGKEAARQADLSPLEQLLCGRLVSREREFAEAKLVWTQAASGVGEQRVLLISGEAGVGKTPLVREIQALATASGGVAMTGECYVEGSAPYAPVTQLIREALAIPGLQLPVSALADLITLAPDLSAQYADLPPNPSLDPLAEQLRLSDSLVTLFSVLSARAPVVLVMEDVQWADGGTLFLLRRLARHTRVAHLKMLLVLTFRDTELEDTCCFKDVLLDFTRERLSTLIKLERLSRQQTQDVLAVMLQQEPPPELLKIVYRVTEGNLFFIEEVCRALIDEGKLYREDGRWRLLDSVKEIRLPQSVRMTIEARVGRLAPQVQDMLRLASVIGREFDYEVLSQACDLDEEAQIDALEAAERAQLISEVKAKGFDLRRPGQVSFAFAHGLIPATLRDTLSGMRKARLHKRIAEAVEALRPDDFEALAYHYNQAGDAANARNYYVQAGERALALYANDDAIRFYSEALALIVSDPAGRFDLLARRAGIYDLVARRQAQQADVEEMLAIAERLKDDARLCDALIALSDFYLVTDFARARQPAEQAVALARRLSDPVREGHALRCLGWGAWKMLDVYESRDALEAAVKYFYEANLLSDAANCLHTLSLVFGFQGVGDIVASQKYAEQAVTLSRQVGDRRQEANSLRRLSVVYMDQFKHAEALPYAEMALALHRELGDREGECFALNVLGMILIWLKRPEEAREKYMQALELGEAIHSLTGIVFPVQNLAWSYYRQQAEFEAGLAFLDGLLAKDNFNQDEYLLSTTYRAKAELLAYLGQYSQALELIQAAAGIAEPISSLTVRATYLSTTGSLQAHLGEFSQANASLDAAIAMVEGKARPNEMAQLLINRATAALLQGQTAGMRTALEMADRATQLLAGTQWKFELSEVLAISAHLKLAGGNVGEALANSNEALKLSTWLPIPTELFFYTHYEVLKAAGRKGEALEYLRQAYERVNMINTELKDKSFRQSWIRNVWVNRKILAAWDVEAQGG